jgi:hypothetical protein
MTKTSAFLLQSWTPLLHHRVWLQRADMTAAVGSACGIHQGELQSSLGNLKAIVNIVTPLVWGRICESPDPARCCGSLIRLTHFVSTACLTLLVIQPL